MTTDAPAFLRALRLADSFLPVGTYTASYGIEQYCNEGVIETSEELRAVLEGYLRRIVGPVEITALSNAHRGAARGGGERLLAVDERVHAVTLPAEFRTSSTRAGEQLLSLVGETERTDSPEPTPILTQYAQAVERGETPGHYPVALGVYTHASEIACEQVCLVAAYAFTTETLGAAQRLGRFGHTDIQTILYDLLPVIEAVCQKYANTPLEEMGSFAPVADVMGMRHERADVRLFMS